MDMQMPVMDGLAASRAIRELGSEKGRVPIIAMTANGFKEDIERCREAGMDAHLSKPFDLSRLQAILDGIDGGTFRTEMPFAPAVEETDIVDDEQLKTLREIFGTDDQVAEMLRQYLTNAAELVARLEEAAVRSDGESLMHLAHDLKSVSGNFGAKAMFLPAAAIELACREGRVADATRLAAGLSDRLSKTKEWLGKKSHVPLWPES
jgi:hypothetical protein